MAKTKLTVLVTGGAQGIGLGIVTRFAVDGWAVICADKNGKAAEKTAAGLRRRRLDVVGVEMDVRDRASIRAALKPYKSIDALVNNAGIYSGGDLKSLAEKDFDLMMSVNVNGLFAVTQETLKRMPNGGRIVNIASRAYLGGAGMAHYAASKGAVVSLTRSMALELGKRDISVNAIAPGLIDTPLVRSLPPKILAERRAQQPNGKMGTPADIANAAVFLASPATHFITGQVLLVDGGKSLGGTAV